MVHICVNILRVGHKVFTILVEENERIHMAALIELLFKI